MFALYHKDDDDELFEGMYEEGHWEWSDKEKRIVFISDIGKREPVENEYFNSAYGGSVPFRDEIEPIELQRFKKRYMRKVPPGDRECITLQDVKDVALFTAPLCVMTVSVINILHLPVTERFIRAIVLYCQYYLQVTDELSKRAIELENKIPTLNSFEIEKEYHDNLEDMRMLVAKEYCTFLIAGDGLKKFHHMGPSKKLRSLSKKDNLVFEALIRITIQIVWLALGRRCFRQIDLEVNRIFKSEIYNMIEHRLKAREYSSMSCRERRVMLGRCLRMDKKLAGRSPLMNEVHCKRYVDFRMFGLGVLDFERLSPRLRFYERALSAPEESLEDFKMTLGIIGMPRGKFDPLLRDVMVVLSSTTGTNASLNRSSSMRKRSSRLSERKSKLNDTFYPDIILPERGEDIEWSPEVFPKQSLPPRPCNLDQRQRWLTRLAMVQSRIRKASQMKK